MVDPGRSEDTEELGALLDPDDALVVTQHGRQGLLETGVDVDGAADVAGGDAVERLEVVAVDGRDRQPAQPTRGADEVLDVLVGGVGE